MEFTVHTGSKHTDNMYELGYMHAHYGRFNVLLSPR